MSLSDKILERVARKDNENPFVERILKTKDVKEFIKLLKDKAKVSKYRSKGEITTTYHINSKDLNELAGDKLI